MEGVKDGEGGGELASQLGGQRRHLDKRVTGVGQLLTETGVERVTEAQGLTRVDLQHTPHLTTLLQDFKLYSTPASREPHMRGQDCSGD